MTADPLVLRRSAVPILAADRPWETGALLSAVALLPAPHGEQLRLYYQALHRDRPLDNVLCLATSTDAVTWDKPELGDGTNVVMRSSGQQTAWGVFMPTRILHEPDADNPAWRWKMVYWERLAASEPAGICLAVSGDGLAWQPLHERPIVTNANDAMSMIGARRGVPTPLGGQARWLLYQQTWAYNPDLPTERDNLKGMHRCISVWRGPARFDGGWVGPITILEPDADDPPDLQLYWLAPYPTASAYGGLLWCHHTGAQTMDVQRVASADGWSWSRRDERAPLLPLGERGRFDCGLITAKAEPCRWRGKVLLPYNGRATVHDGQMRFPGDPAGGCGHRHGGARPDPAGLMDEPTYHALRDQIEGLLTESRVQSRQAVEWEKVEAYWHIGDALAAHLGAHPGSTYGRQVVRNLCKNLKLGYATLYETLRFRRVVAAGSLGRGVASTPGGKRGINHTSNGLGVTESIE